MQILQRAEQKRADGADPEGRGDDADASAEGGVVVAAGLAAGMAAQDGVVGGEACHAGAFLEEAEGVRVGRVDDELRDEDGEDAAEEDERGGAAGPLVEVEDLDLVEDFLGRRFGDLGEQFFFFDSAKGFSSVEIADGSVEVDVVCTGGEVLASKIIIILIICERD